MFYPEQNKRKKINTQNYSNQFNPKQNSESVVWETKPSEAPELRISADIKHAGRNQSEWLNRTKTLFSKALLVHKHGSWFGEDTDLLPPQFFFFVLTLFCVSQKAPYKYTSIEVVVAQIHTYCNIYPCF